MQHEPKKILVLGGGFGGLTFCRAFSHPDAQITLIDAQNHHLFQPLLYQVAAAGLSAPEIAEPIRSILSDKRDVTVLMDTVEDINLSKRQVHCRSHTLDYDYLVTALGGVTTYFGHPEWAAHAPGLKSLEDALRIRNDVLLAFEQAETETDPDRRQALMTLVVVGGGPTGVELAGSFAELAKHVLRRDFRRIDPEKARIILIEAGPRLLPQMPEALSRKALQQLREFHVEVMLDTRVADIQKGFLRLADGQTLHADNIIWSAGIMAHPLAARFQTDQDGAGRVKVGPDLSIPDHPEVFVIGDLASVQDAKGTPVPGVSPAAIQMAQHVSRIIRQDLDQPDAPRPSFRYRDKGTMATIGRSAAVVKIGPFEFGGFMAWLVWLFVHILFLIGFDNKLTVMIQWAHAYFTYKRGARVILRNLDGKPLPTP